MTLAAHPYRAELCGSPKDLTWPVICASCGNSASERIVVRKAFSTGSSSSRRSRSHQYSYWYKVYSAPVPFCAACAREHRATVRRPTLVGAVAAVLFHPNIIAVIGCAWLLKWALSDVSWTSLNDPQMRRALPFAAIFALGLVWSLLLAWSLTRPQRIEPQTEVTLACDFSRDVSAFYERERHMYALRNKDFADALVQANQERVWTSEDRVRSSKVQGIVTAVGVVCLVVAAIIWLR